jgi:hypothetical protein
MKHQPAGIAPEARIVDTITAGSASTLVSGGLVKELMVLSVILTIVVVAIYVSFA